MSDYIPEPSPRVTIIVFVVILLGIVGAAALLISTQPQPVQITINPPVPTSTAFPTGTPAPITVYITGAVAEPEQTLTLPSGSRVQDAIDAAGGMTETADLELVNLAGILRDGDQVHVPEQNQEVALPTASGGGIVHINTATVEELDTLPGVGPALAERIIAYRDANGAFTSLEDLDNVEGIGPALIGELQGLIAFD